MRITKKKNVGIIIINFLKSFSNTEWTLLLICDAMDLEIFLTWFRNCKVLNIFKEKDFLVTTSLATIRLIKIIKERQKPTTKNNLIAKTNFFRFFSLI